MNARTRKAQLHLAQEPFHNPYAEYNVGLQDLFCHAMDQALGIQKVSLNAVVKMQNNVIELQKHAFEAEPAIGNVFEAASQAYATCLEIQLSWLDTFVSLANQAAETWYKLAAMGSSLAGIPAGQPQPTMEGEEESISYRAGAA